MTYLFSEKSPIVASWVAIMDHRRSDRRLMLSDFQTRCVRRGEIHEFLLCSSPPPAGERPIDEVAYLGFAEFQNAGVIAVGDEVWLGRQQAGTILGFDETHMPNHMNIVLRGGSLECGAERGLLPHESVFIRARARGDSNERDLPGARYSALA